MDVITTHVNADFDGLGAMVAAKKLYPQAVLAFPGSQEKTLRQFLVESITLSMTGGVLGILLGFGLASLVSVLSPLPYAIQPWSIVAGLFVTFAVGIFFGLYPANRAAKLDPVEALRHE